jgi:hypothetical protein
VITLRNAKFVVVQDAIDRYKDVLFWPQLVLNILMLIFQTHTELQPWTMLKYVSVKS